MGNDNEAEKIRNEHAEKMEEIEAMKDIKEQELAIKRFAEENGYKLELKRIEMLVEQIRNVHERKLIEIEIIGNTKKI
jgi:hypothetical protein